MTRVAGAADYGLVDGLALDGHLRRLLNFYFLLMDVELVPAVLRVHELSERGVALRQSLVLRLLLHQVLLRLHCVQVQLGERIVLELVPITIRIIFLMLSNLIEARR